MGKLDTYLGLVKRLITNLNAARIDYMFTGAIAASYYGTPRTTMDVDIIIHTTQQNTAYLNETLQSAGLHTDKKKIDNALNTGYNIATLKDIHTPYSLDIILAKDPLEKRSATISELPTYIQTPEHLILSKLRMIKASLNQGKAAKDEGDIRSILEYTQVDLDNVKKNARREDTYTILKSIIR